MHLHSVRTGAAEAVSVPVPRMSSPTAGLSLAAKADLIKQQLGLPVSTSIPDAVAAAAQMLELHSVESLALAHKVEACCQALFGASILPVEAGDDATVHGASSTDLPPGDDTPAGEAQQPQPPLVLAAEPSPIAALRTAAKPTAAVSSAHHVVSAEALHAYLATLGLDRMLAELGSDQPSGAMGERREDEQTTIERDEQSAEARWYAEHARAQLSPTSGCESRPAWVARVAVDAVAESSSALGGGEDDLPVVGDEEETSTHAATRGRRVSVSLWASDAKAARRALLALQLERTGLSVHVHAYACVPAGASGSGGGSGGVGYAAQVRRWAYEHDTYELRDEVDHEASSVPVGLIPVGPRGSHGDGGSGGNGGGSEGGAADAGAALYSAVLHAATASADLARLRESRASAAEADGQGDAGTGSGSPSSNSEADRFAARVEQDARAIGLFFSSHSSTLMPSDSGLPAPYVDDERLELEGVAAAVRALLEPLLLAARTMRDRSSGRAVAHERATVTAVGSSG